MKKTLIFLIISLAFIALFNYSCTKDKNNYIASKGQIQFSISGNEQKMVMNLVSDSAVSASLSAAVVTIVDASGKIIENSVNIPLTNMNGNYISNPISLVTGNYQLTEFLLVNKNNQVVYASPLKGSKLAYLVTNPLPINFSVQTDIVTNIIPEVISALTNTPQDFGYASFSFSIDSTFNILVGAFIYNSTAKNYEITNAGIKIYSDSAIVYAGQLDSLIKPSSGNNTVYDSLGITSKITLPAKYNTFTVNISKPNFATYSQTFTKSQLRQYFLKTDKGPLVVILKSDSVPTTPSLDDGLVLYLTMNGDVKDHSGYNNNGTAYGTLTPTTDHKGKANAAYYFNGTDSYIEVPDAPSLNPKNQISISVWFCPISFVGSGNDPIIDKPYMNHSAPYYQYHFGVTGDGYIDEQSQFGFDISPNNIYGGAKTSPGFYQPGIWYHLVGTYDDSNVKIYVNSNLISTVPTTGDLTDYGRDIYIGKYGNSGYYLPGSMSELKIYNRALSQAEIISLYKL